MYSRRRRRIVYYHSTSFLFLLLVSFSSSRAFNHQVRFRQHTTEIGASPDPLQISDILQQIVSGISPDDEAIVINDVAEAAEDIVGKHILCSNILKITRDCYSYRFGCL